MVSLRSVSKNLENRDVGRLSADVGTDFGWIFFIGRRLFFVEAPKLKVSLTDPPIFMGFFIGEASGEYRPTVSRRFEVTSWQRSMVARSIGRLSPDDRSMTFYQRTVGRQTPDIDRHSADDRPTVGRSLSLVCVIFFFATDVSTFMTLNYAFMWVWDSFHMTLCTRSICFLCSISNWTIRMTFRH